MIVEGKKCWLDGWNCSYGHRVIDWLVLPTLPCQSPEDKMNFVSHWDYVFVCESGCILTVLNWIDETFSQTLVLYHRIPKNYQLLTITCSEAILIMQQNKKCTVLIWWHIIVFLYIFIIVISLVDFSIEVIRGLTVMLEKKDGINKDMILPSIQQNRPAVRTLHAWLSPTVISHLIHVHTSQTLCSSQSRENTHGPMCLSLFDV